MGQDSRFMRASFVHLLRE